jgi:hypothetical protein
MHCGMTSRYSITSSARTSSGVGTSSPRVLAALRLMADWYLVGNWISKPAGLSPFRMRTRFVPALITFGVLLKADVRLPCNIDRSVPQGVTDRIFLTRILGSGAAVEVVIERRSP